MLFERFTDRAQKAVVIAQEQARLMQYGQVTPVHLLLGLALEGEDLPARLLVEKGYTTDVVLATVHERIGNGIGSPAGDIPFSAATKKTLELSLRQALQLGHNYIGTEHLLLALARQVDPALTPLLAELLGDYDTIRRDVLDRLSSHVPRTPRVIVLRPGETESTAEVPFEALLGLMTWYQGHYEGSSRALLLDEAHPIRVLYEALRDALQHQAGGS